MENDPPAELFEFLAPYSSSIRELFLGARELVYEVAADATESVNDAPYTVSTNYTYTHSYVLGFLHIAAAQKHVNIGFDYGVDLTDPERRLLGDGKRVRHISLRAMKDLKEPYLHDLIRQAQARAHRPPEPREPQTIILRMNGSKRRP
jgi:hypothetical protein